MSASCTVKQHVTRPGVQFVGELDGALEGRLVEGCLDGTLDGLVDGSAVAGAMEGEKEGLKEGCEVSGVRDGDLEGTSDGCEVVGGNVKSKQRKPCVSSFGRLLKLVVYSTAPCAWKKFGG